jgi:hypothetical protein
LCRYYQCYNLDSDSRMERAGRVLGNLAISRREFTDEQIALAAWSVAVGKRLALRTNPVRLVRNRLVVEVEDAVWQRQLFALRYQIIPRIETAAGRRIVEELEFRVAIPRRQPERAETSRTPADEADGILDPTMRNIYKASRRKATA